MVKILIKGEIMEKEFWKSWTFWGILAWVIVGVFEIYASDFPELGKIAKSLALALTAFGFRRAMG